MRHARVAFVLTVALLLLASCGMTTTTTSSTSNSSPSATGVTSKLCQRMATINQSLAQLSTIGDNTTVGEVKAAQAKLTSALTALAALPLPSGGGGDALSNLQAANDQLAAALKGLPDSATIGQTSARLQAVKGKVAQAQAAATKLTSTLNCKA